MRLVSFQARGRASHGVITKFGIVDVGFRLSCEDGIRGLLDAGVLPHLSRFADSDAADFSLYEVDLLPPTPVRNKIFSVVGNYRDGQRTATHAPESPIISLKGPSAFVGHQSPIVRPRSSVQFDYVGAIAVVIGKQARYISEARALNYVAGLTICSECTARDWIRETNITKATNFDQSASLGPWIETVNSDGKLEDLRLKTWVNNDLREDGDTRNLLVSFAGLIQYISSFTMPEPGDLIISDVSTKVGASFVPARFLERNDFVRVEVSGLGVLENRIIDEQELT